MHKVTIVPRGRALGLTASLPEEDRHSHTRDWLNGQLAMLFGGRVAEELVFGPEKVTTGAGNDIERATAMARRMVTRFGMSDRIGLMAVGDSEQEVFLGRELVQRREVSDYTAQQVDEEVKQHPRRRAPPGARDDHRREPRPAGTPLPRRCWSGRRWMATRSRLLLDGQVAAARHQTTSSPTQPPRPLPGAKTTVAAGAAAGAGESGGPAAVTRLTRGLPGGYAGDLRGGVASLTGSADSGAAMLSSISRRALAGPRPDSILPR